MRKTYMQPQTAVVKIALHEGILAPTSIYEVDAAGDAMTKEDDWDELWEE